MMMPSIFGRDMFDDFFSFPFNAFRTSELDHSNIAKAGMITMDIPGVDKDHVQAELKDGYLTIQASTDSNNEEKDENGRFLRRERHYGSCSRSFYVGEAVTQDEIKAKFENGTLKMLVPKKESKPAVEDRKYIAIEG